MGGAEGAQKGQDQVTQARKRSARRHLIEDYALLGDTQTAALVSKKGSLDWMCVPRFDSPACFAAIVGDDAHGTWTLHPACEVQRIERCYRPDTLVLETTLHTKQGVVRIVDFMPFREGDHPSVVRIVEGVAGDVPMQMRLSPRCDYGSVVPLLTSVADGVHHFIAGPDALRLDTQVDCTHDDAGVVAEFLVKADERMPFTLAWWPAHHESPPRVDPIEHLVETEKHWRKWVSQCTYEGPWRDEIVRSIMTLKALTYKPSGGIVAAPTTSLPELIGGVRNWDYRYSWLRDGAWSLLALVRTGFTNEALAFRDWLLRAVAGDPAKVKIMYGLRGERRIGESEMDWLPGYENSGPVRLGNGAHGQLQLDVFGELLGVLWVSLRANLPPSREMWKLGDSMLAFLETKWREPDEGIWEIRGQPRHFTHSKLMAWQAFRLAAAIARKYELPGPIDQWERSAAELREWILKEGYCEEKNAFTQYLGGKALDAALLGLPNFRFLPDDDPRVSGTIDAIVKELGNGDFVYRYELCEDDAHVDGLPGGEGAFFGLSFMLVDALTRIGRLDDAKALFERLLALSNDVGLYAEEYCPHDKRFLGNFPQALTHTGLVNAGVTLARALAKREGG